MSGVRIRLLEAAEAGLVGAAIKAVYGDTYPVTWVYDAKEVARRLAGGLLVSAVAEVDGQVVCHAGLTLRHPRDKVGHCGQAVTLPAARGHHLFTATKRFLVSWAAERGLVGLYSEATAAHPYSQRANVELGGVETGFLLGFIPESERSGITSRPRRQSAALFYLHLNPAPPSPLYAPARYHEVLVALTEKARFHARLADPPARRILPAHSALHTTVEDPAGRATVTLRRSGADVAEILGHLRERLFGQGVDVLYADLPLDQPETALGAEALHEAGFCFAGVFPHCEADGDILRLQSLRPGTVAYRDVAVASAHGRHLLDVVVGDLEAAGHEVVHPASP